MNQVLQFILDNWVSVTGAFIGLIFLYLEYKANVWMWAASIVMALFYIFIFYQTGLYASMCIYIYFFFASIYGWIMWVMRNRDKDTKEEIIQHTPGKYLIPVVSGVAVVFALIYIALYQINDSVVITVGDALTTSLNIVALWMISRKWVEQWLLIIPANLISCVLLFIQNDIMSCILFFIYFVVSIFGYIKWKSLASPLMLTMKTN